MEDKEKSYQEKIEQRIALEKSRKNLKIKRQYRSLKYSIRRIFKKK